MFWVTKVLTPRSFLTLISLECVVSVCFTYSNIIVNMYVNKSSFWSAKWEAPPQNGYYNIAGRMAYPRQGRSFRPDTGYTAEASNSVRSVAMFSY